MACQLPERLVGGKGKRYAEKVTKAACTLVIMSYPPILQVKEQHLDEY